MTPIPINGGHNAVLLIHGLSGNPREMQYLARRLQATGFSVCVPYKQVSRWRRRHAAGREI